MYNFTRMPAMRTVGHFAQSVAATAAKPKTNFGSSTYKTFARAVKLTVIIMLLGLLQASARTTAQTRISLKLRGATLEKVFAEIEKRSGYTVFYNTEVLQAAGTSLVSIDIKDATIDDVMHQCLKGLPLEFSVQDKTIFVKKEARRVAVETATGPGSPIPSTFSGIVRTEAGAPLMGASVYVLKLKKTVATDKDGVFTLKDVPDGEYEVVISFIGYENYRTKVSVSNHEAWLSADLRQSMSRLDETVVKGYYSTTNRLNTGDVTTVKGEEIQQQPVSDPILALEGRVPGLYIQQTSGVPGAYSTIQIRGQNSIANGNAPLYIVDGVPYSSTSLTNTGTGQGVLGSPVSGPGAGASPFDYLNPSDIERIEVLKDADATAIYGSRGANGVILITTKRGKPGHTKFDINAYTGAGSVTHMLKLLDTRQYLEMRREAFKNDGLPVPSINTNSSDGNFDINGVWDTTRNTNWQKALIGNTAQFNNLQANLSGGDDHTQFVLGGGYSNQGTVYPGHFSDQKGMAHFNLTHSSSDQRLHAQLTASYVYDNSNLPQSDFATQVILAPDAPELYLANGNLNWQLFEGSATWGNPLATELQLAKATTDNLITNLNVSYSIFSGLQLRSSFGYTKTQMNSSILTPGSSFPPPYDTYPNLRSNQLGTSDFSTWIIEPQVDYQAKIGGGQLSTLVGSTFQQNSQTEISYGAYGFSSDALISDPLAGNTQYLNAMSNTLYHYTALFARVGYNWGEKYLINATARRDGSSRFGPDRQFGNFGAVGAAWIFSHEKFIQNALPFLSFGKLRGSYGSTGNDQITDYQYLSTYSANSTTYDGVTGLYPTRLSNPYFGWELVKKLEGGIELGFLRDRILLTGSYYRNRTGNQLVGYPLPQLTGFTTVQANLPAIVQNTGFEIVLNTININSKSFIWKSSVNLTIPQNKLVAYPNLASSSYKYAYVIGKSLFIRKVAHFVGINDSTGVYQYASKSGPTDNPAFPGDYISSKPITQQFYGGILNTLSYKGFQLDFLVQYVKQRALNYFYNSGYSAGTFNNNEPNVVLDRWQSPGNMSKYGLFSTSFAADPNSVLYKSDYGIQDGSFIRLKNIALSYQMPAYWKKLTHLQSTRIYIQCQNLFTITKFIGLDPETGGSLTLPPLRMITGGIQLSL